MSCSACHLDLRAATFFVCAECSDPAITLCILCFSGKHKSEYHFPDHDYYVVPGAALENSKFGDHNLGNVMTLVDCIRKVSFGSWREVSTRSNITQTDETERILSGIYMMWMNLRDGATSHTIAEVQSTQLDSIGAVIDRSYKPSLRSDMPGFMDRRCDFDIEYDASAELIVADLELNDDDGGDERAAKIECMRQLVTRFRRRASIKDFVRESHLLTIQNQIDSLRAKTAEEVELIGKTRPLRRFFEESHHADLFNQVLLHEKRLNQRIALLKQQNSTLDTGYSDNLNQSVRDSVRTDVPPAEFDDRLITRGRAQVESRRVKLTDAELTKVRELSDSEIVSKSISQHIDSSEVDALSRFGLTENQFALLKGAILKRFQDSNAASIGLVMQKYGESIVVRGLNEVWNVKNP